MPRLLFTFGLGIGAAGTLGGALLLLSRYQAYLATIRANRGAFFAPMIWQLSAGLAAAIIVLSLLFAFLMVVLGRTLRRVERLEAREARAEAPPG